MPAHRSRRIRQIAAGALVGVLGTVAGIAAATPAHAVLNGTVLADDAVNRATVSVGGVCSGTLVTPDVVLTAGHCIDHRGPNPLPHPSYGLADPKINDDDWEYPGEWNTLYQHPGGIAIRFGTDLDQPATLTRQAVQYTIATNSDAVLLKLDVGVAPEVAVPVPLLTRVPSSNPDFLLGKNLTIAGFGGTTKLRSGGIRTTNRCYTDRNYICANHTDASGAIPGDSGGSVFWTDGNGQRWLVGSMGIMSADGSGFVAFLDASRRYMEDATSKFPDMQAHYERLLGAPDLAFAKVNADGTLVPEGSQAPAGGWITSWRWLSSGIIGAYQVSLPMPAGPATVAVTAIASDGSYCQVLPNGPTGFIVFCFDGAGQRAWRSFEVVRSTRWSDAKAQIQANGTAASVASGKTTSGATPIVIRSGVGAYQVQFPGNANLRNVVVTPVSSASGATCRPTFWGSDYVNVACTRPGAVATDAGFFVMAASSLGDTDPRGDMFAWASLPTQSGQYETSRGFGQQNAPYAPHVTRLGAGRYRVAFYGAQNTRNGVFVVSAYGSTSARCAIADPRGFDVDVQCSGMSNGAAVDAMFTIRYLKPAN